MKRSVYLILSTAMLGLAAGAATAMEAGADEGFDRYAIILSKEPFGVPEAPPPAPAPAPPPSSPSMMQELRVCAITDFEGRGIRASVVENKTNRSYTLRIGETIDDLTLLAADVDSEEVTIQRGSETAVMKLAAGQGGKKAPARPTPSVSKVSSVVTAQKYADRRKAIEEKRQANKFVRAPPKYTGERLREHLREYNMEAIRKGLPPLPVELTPAQDDQLVAEGLLPARQDSFTSANDPLLLQAVEQELQQDMQRR
jgi:hypothetical protein